MYLKSSMTDSGLGATGGHAGTQFDPLPNGGTGGEGNTIVSIMKSGITFSQIHFENGVLGEKYILALGFPNQMFYKFHMLDTGPGVGTPSDRIASSWFNGIVSNTKTEMKLKAAEAAATTA